MMENDEESPTDFLSSDEYNRKISTISPLDDHSLSSDDDHDDDSLDEEAEQAVKGDMIIAERTNQLMNDFRSYISDIQGGGDAKSSPDIAAEYGEGAGITAENEGSLMRSWGDSISEGPSVAKPYRDDPLYDVSYGYGDIRDDVVLTRSAYGGRSTYSKKLKKCLVGSILAGVLLGAIIGIVQSNHRKQVEKSLPDWEGELAEIQEEAKVKGSGGGAEPQHTEQVSHNPQVGEGLQKPPSLDGEEPNAFYADAQGLDETGGNAPDMMNGSPSNQQSDAQDIVNSMIESAEKPSHQYVETTFEAKWFSRDSGWSGETYDQGLVFCSKKMDSVGLPMVPCLYEAYCPEGPQNEPFGGMRTDGIEWAPVYDVVNDWVMVGSAENTCGLYSDMYSDPPEWGEKGGNKYTKSIMCCKSLKSYAGVDSEANEVNDSANESSTNMNTEPTDAVSDEEIEAKQQMQEAEFNLASEEYKFAETYKPVWFNREQTWSGQTWSEADNFCKTKQNSRLCPYEVYCPTGPNHLPYGGVRPETVVWAPIIDANNAWVSVSKQNTCVTYTVLNLMNPEWGITGADNEEMTRHIMCCKDPNKVVTSSVQDSSVAVSDSSPTAAETFASDTVETTADTQSAASDTAATATDTQPTHMSEEDQQQLYQIVSKEYKPMTFTREKGWDGQTYTSAMIFCASQESKVLCPYEVVCPLGPNEIPISGKYAPIIDAPNAWVSLGSCDLFSRTEPYPPIWGLTDKQIDASDLTEVIVCCDELVDVSPVTPTDKLLDGSHLAALDDFKPQWFGRDHGYTGRSYEDAELFCERIGNMELCPYEAYCPNGVHSSDKTPLFPNRVPFGSEQWAPFKSGSSERNSYLLVGPADNNPTTICLTHEELYSKDPNWEDGNTQLKQNILCCMSENNLQLEDSIKKEFNPQWLGVSDGWGAGSYADAVSFCESKSLSLCPFHAVCPLGPSNPVHGGHAQAFFGEQWVPFIGSENSWALVGQKFENAATTCLTHEQVEGSPPSWGLTSENKDVKQHILCCSL